MRREKNSSEGMSLIVKTVTRWLKGFILLFGIHVVLYGHVSPGGGFAGGVIIACGFILLTLAEGQRVGLKTLSKGIGGVLGSVGALLFLGVALEGLRRSGTFFLNFTAASGTTHPWALHCSAIELCEIGIAFVVSMSLYVVFTVLAGTHTKAEGAERDSNQRGRD